MKNIFTKPLKDWNIVDMGIASIGAIALIPVVFWLTMKSFGFIDKIENRQKIEKTEE